MTHRTAAETPADKLRRLRGKRSDDMLALVLALGSIPVARLGEVDAPGVDSSSPLWAMSSRELRWYTQDVASLQEYAGRGIGTMAPTLAVTPQYRLTKLTVTYKPRYYLMRGNATQVLTQVFVFYGKPQAAILPQARMHALIDL